ncbi:hypothetical protein [Pseudomonas carnis]|uniref:hypothetical protein n=1 Tax=Pseudomonas carnis TaxID=2487355 RepID=UPI0018E61132|nr:hypothetical protein [Pseudomonas carnis]MBI6655688.1 hypothetical protein [Pseudomonas carnis]
MANLFRLELEGVLNKSVPFCYGWMINLEAYKQADMSLFENLGSMPPALLVNYGALYDKYRPAIESEKKREN